MESSSGRQWEKMEGTGGGGGIDLENLGRNQKGNERRAGKKAKHPKRVARITRKNEQKGQEKKKHAVKAKKKKGPQNEDAGWQVGRQKRQKKKKKENFAKRGEEGLKSLGCGSRLNQGRNRGGKMTKPKKGGKGRRKCPYSRENMSQHDMVAQGGEGGGLRGPLILSTLGGKQGEEK